LVALLTWPMLIKSIEETSPYNTHYTIPFWYGSRFDERNSRAVILNDDPTQFFWSHTFNVDYRRNLWVADKKKHSLLYISKESETWNAMFKIAGREFVPGSRNGNIGKATFNNPISVCVYDQNITKIALARSIKPIYLFENKVNDTKCLKEVNKDNYMECGTMILSDEDLLKVEAGDLSPLMLPNKTAANNKTDPRNNPNLLLPNNPPPQTPGSSPDAPQGPRLLQNISDSDNSTATNSTGNGTSSGNDTETQMAYKRDEVRSYNDQMINGTKLDFRRVKYIPFATLTPAQKNFSYSSASDPRVAYIADKDNHCVRRLEVDKKNVDTYAGVCT